MLRGGTGDRKAADLALTLAERAVGNPFEKSVVAACRGLSDGKAALAAPMHPNLQCCAYYYLGAKALVDGRTDEARALLQKSFDAGPNELPEFYLARWHLAQLGGR